MGFQGILFDLGNTLLHFNGDYARMTTEADEALITSLKEAGLALDGEQFERDFRNRLTNYHLEREINFVEHTTKHILQKLLAEYGFEEVPDRVLEEGLKNLYGVSQAQWIPEEDALPTLKVLRKNGLRLGVVSNAGDDADVQRLVDKAGIRPYLDFVLSSAVHGLRKPDTTIFEQALEFWGFSPDEVAMVGDTLDADILGANRVGLFSIWLTRRASSPANHANRETIVPDAVIRTLDELPALLESMEAR